MHYTLKVDTLSLRKLVLRVLAISLIFSLGYVLGSRGYKVSQPSFLEFKVDRSVPENKNVDFSLFWKVWDTLGVSYYDKSKLNPSKMVEGAISGMVAAIGDPYTVYLPPEENKVVEEDLQGSFGGVGIQIGFKGKQLAVVAPLPDTPAEKAGVKAGDFILAIKDEKKKIDKTTGGMSLPEAVQIIRGPAGSEVTLTLLRDGQNEPIEVKLVRADIKVPSVILTFEGKNKDIAYLKLLKFGGETENEWNNAVSKIISNNTKGIILDLRNNPGGYLQGAVDIASDFLKLGTVVVSQEVNGKKDDFKTSRLPRLPKYPLVILVNEGSASASEILAGALRDQAEVKLVGKTTFGKGTIQEPKTINGGAGLHITIARWLTPKGEWVNEKGLKPDIEVDDKPDTTEDEQFNKALEVLKI
ncbi:MAG: S41 family C-terminal processing peptidase [Candidatus Woesebacteria bacterium]|nr:MAG: S41 family C-terminal processing peptidase [Candidatus Woesebacteria bacterium]